MRCTCGNEFTTRSTEPELHVEICSNCHPFYTGKQKLVDTGGRVERFRRRAARRSAPSRAQRTARRSVVERTCRTASPSRSAPGGGPRGRRCAPGAPDGAARRRGRRPRARAASAPGRGEGDAVQAGVAPPPSAAWSSAVRCAACRGTARMWMRFTLQERAPEGRSRPCAPPAWASGASRGRGCGGSRYRQRVVELAQGVALPRAWCTTAGMPMTARRLRTRPPDLVRLPPGPAAQPAGGEHRGRSAWPARPAPRATWCGWATVGRAAAAGRGREPGRGRRRDRHPDARHDRAGRGAHGRDQRAALRQLARGRGRSRRTVRESSRVGQRARGGLPAGALGRRGSRAGGAAPIR